jgi:NAD-dependent SIR2 family protein deacetylase
MQIEVGNLCEQHGESYRWLVFLKTPDRCIKSASMRIHPTFKQQHVHLTQKDQGTMFQSKAFRGWGTFVIPILIKLADGECLEVEHELSFNGPSTSSVFTFGDDPSTPEAVNSQGAAAIAAESLKSTTAEGTSAEEITQPITIAEEITQPITPPSSKAKRPHIPGQGEDNGIDISLDIGHKGETPKEKRKRLTAEKRAAKGKKTKDEVIAAEENSQPIAITRAPLLRTLDPTDPQIFFGRGYSGELKLPREAWVSKMKPRDDHDAPEWLTATEFEDQACIMIHKCEHLAELLKKSRKTVVYSGAGISVAAGIGQAARGRAVGGKSTDALPTFTHYALGALSKHGLVHEWVQQNHDGLPQKAGFPQEQINEIHGSWYDPSNPVVKYGGNLKDDAYPRMTKSAETADLVLVLGTSLGGLNADQVATKTANRSLDGRALGTVIINLQQTEQDVHATLRVFGKTDEVFRLLLQQLGITKINQSPSSFGWKGGDRCSRILVPYDKKGRRSTAVKTWLDLRPGKQVQLADDHNVQGAKQPVYMHIGANEPHSYRGQLRQPGKGVGVVSRRDDKISGFHLEIDGVRMLLGQWWLEAARRGGPAQLPVINVNPEQHTPS